jgi:2-phosphosulfolactate phosphatase
MPFTQSTSTLHCEWGLNGVAQLAPISNVVIIVDVLSFSTCVEIAASREAIIFPYRWRDERAATFAAEVDAELAESKRTHAGYSLSPQSLLNIPKGARLVLPSPNGPLRPALEDWLCAGAILGELTGTLSPEARSASAAFRDAQPEIESLIRHCGSGRELSERGFEANVALAAAMNVSECVPLLVNGAYVPAGTQGTQR